MQRPNLSSILARAKHIPMICGLPSSTISTAGGTSYLQRMSDADSLPAEIDMLCDFPCPAVNHQMFVLESNSDDPRNSDYAFKGQLDSYDQFAIDGTYFRHSTGLYHVYSCWYEANVS